MRLSPITMAVVGGAIGITILLAGILLDFGGDPAAQPESAAEPDAAAAVAARPESEGAAQPTALRRRGRPIPKFEVVAPKAPPPSAAAPPGEPPEIRELKEKASQDNFVYREAGTDQIYIVKNGTRWPVKGSEDLQALGIDPATVQEVPQNVLRGVLRSQPPDRTFWRERDKAEVFYYENGQKRWITDEAFKRLSGDYKAIQVLPSGGLTDHTHGAPILR